MTHHSDETRRRKGFTLVELAVVVVIIGVLAAFAVPMFIASVERSKAAEAFNYLSAVQAAQERYHARQGTYANNISDLDIALPAPKYFKTCEHGFHEGTSGSFEDSWRMILERTGPSAGYGKYRVTFTQDGYDPDDSTIDPEINPMAT